MSIVKAIKKAYINKDKKNWDKLYFFFDIHETILVPDYGEDKPLEFYPWAKEILSFLSKQEDIVMCIYTCSYPKEINKYVGFFKEHEIEFTYINDNPEAENNSYGFYEDKPYFNVLFEDKAGFDAKEDWVKILQYYLSKDSWYVSSFLWHTRNPKYGTSQYKSFFLDEAWDLFIEHM